MTSNRHSRIIRLLVTTMVLTGTTAVAAASTSDASTSATTSASTSCSLTWGSLPKAEGAVAYVPQVYTEGKGDVVTLRGGAALHIVVRGDVAAVRTGRHPCYDRLVVDLAPSAHLTAQPGQRVADVSGYATFRDVAYAGSFEGYTSFGLGVRARLPMRVFTLSGPGDGGRLVVDVAHHW